MRVGRSMDVRLWRRLRNGALTWLALFLLWILFVDSLERPEVIAGLGAATLTLPLALLISARVQRHFTLRLGWLRELRQAPANVLRDTLVVFGALFGQLTRRAPMQGRFRLVPFHVAPGNLSDDEQFASWVAFAVIGTSVTPNAYIIGVDAERGLALVHQLTTTPAQELLSSVIGAEPPAPPSQRQPPRRLTRRPT